MGIYCFDCDSLVSVVSSAYFSFSSSSSLSFSSSFSSSSSFPSYLFSLIVKKNRSWPIILTTIHEVSTSMKTMSLACLSCLKHYAGHGIRIRKIFPSWHFLSSGALDMQIDNYRYYNRKELVISWMFTTIMHLHNILTWKVVRPVALLTSPVVCGITTDILVLTISCSIYLDSKLIWQLISTVVHSESSWTRRLFFSPDYRPLKYHFSMC